MVGWPPRVCWIGTLKSQRYKVEFINESINGTHRIVFGDPVIQSLREEHRLVSTLAFDESLHGGSVTDPFLKICGQGHGLTERSSYLRFRTYVV